MRSMSYCRAKTSCLFFEHREQSSGRQQFVRRVSRAVYAKTPGKFPFGGLLLSVFGRAGAYCATSEVVCRTRAYLVSESKIVFD